MPSLLFDSAALAQAVDTRRRALGRTWAHVTAETHVSTSTIRRAGDMEVDGVVWLLQWLGVPFEAFLRTPGAPGIELAAGTFAPDDGFPPGAPRWPAYHRFDTAKLYEALEHRRAAQDLTWQQVGTAIGFPHLTAASLQGFQNGRRTTLAALVPLLGWLGEPAATFTTLSATARGRRSATD